MDQAAMTDYDVKHFFSSGVYSKQMTLKKGRSANSHKHTFDHLSILAAGVAEVEAGGVIETFTAPACIEIKAGITHKITALEDVTWFCIHATSETDASTIDSTLIKGE